MEAFLQHGTGTKGPFLTEQVEIKEDPMWWHNTSRTYTASGYGEKIPTVYMVKYKNRWRRVYAFQISNNGTLFIGRSLRSGIVVNVYQ